MRLWTGSRTTLLSGPVPEASPPIPNEILTNHGRMTSRFLIKFRRPIAAAPTAPPGHRTVARGQRKPGGGGLPERDGGTPAPGGPGTRMTVMAQTPALYSVVQHRAGWQPRNPPSHDALLKCPGELENLSRFALRWLSVRRLKKEWLAARVSGPRLSLIQARLHWFSLFPRLDCDALDHRCRGFKSSGPLKNA